MQDKGWYILVVEEAQQADFTQQALDVFRVLERVRNLLQRDLKHAQPAITELVRDRLSAIKSRQAAGRTFPPSLASLQDATTPYDPCQKAASIPRCQRIIANIT